MDSNVTAIIVQLLILGGSLITVNIQHKANVAKLAAGAKKKQEADKISARAREIEETNRLQTLQREIQEAVWKRAKSELVEMEKQIAVLRDERNELRAAINILRADLDAEREKRVGLSVELASTKNKLDIAVQALKDAEVLREEKDEEIRLLRQRIDKLETKADTGPLSPLTGVSPEK